jgi:hypothetical protein
MSPQAERMLLTIPEAAEAFGCSVEHIKRLVQEADRDRRSRWRWNRELVDLALRGSSRRMVRINALAVAPRLSPP